MGLLERLKHWEARADAWAERRLEPEDFREAVEFDRYLKANWARLGLGYVAIALLLAVLLVGIKPSIPWGEALVLGNVLIVSLAILLAGVWFGHRRHAGKPLWRRAVVITLVTALGAMCGAMGVRLFTGTAALLTQTPELIRFVSVGLLVGLLVSVLLAGVTWIRSREARSREAALRAEAERERFSKRTTEAELKLLQAQVEPHFLFNTLANLRYLVQTGSGEALPMLDHLIDYLRTALPEMRREGSTVGREAELARAYLEIIRIRMGGDLSFSVAFEEGLAQSPFPPLMLMTLVENAVKHGVAPLGRGRIDVRLAREAGVIRAVVVDDGRGVPVAPGTGVGLANVRERLAVLYGERGSIALEPVAEGGARAILVVPDEGKAANGAMTPAQASA